ncbi:MAG: site-specific DNA-methyltransferase [Halanaerobiales bacterium]|nr:site-specific DNA-methyltransferase [Halanaerobiales bacterium]
MNELDIRVNNVPANIEDLSEFVIIGKAVLSAHKLKIATIKKIDKANEAYQAALLDGQNIAEIVIDAEARMGAILNSIPKKKKTEQGSGAGTLLSLPEGIDKKQSHYAQEMFKHPDIVEEAKKEAKDNGELITQLIVINKIKEEKKIAKLPIEDQPRAKELIANKEVKNAGMATKKIRVEKRIEEYKQSDFAKPTIALADMNDWLADKEQCDLLLTDPPYSTDVDDIADFSNWIFSAAEKVKTTGSMYICIGSYQSEVLAYLSKDIPNFELTNILVWKYDNGSQKQPNSSYIKNYQFILYYRGIDAPQINKPGNSTEQYSCFTINAPDGRQADRDHTWQKPEELGTMLIKNSTNIGDLIYDPFACTGTFLLAASKLNRVAKGCDIDKDNLNIAIKRGCINE